MQTKNEAEILYRLLAIDNELSPENLHCDGELPLAKVREKKKRLEQERSTLVKELGREPRAKDFFSL